MTGQPTYIELGVPDAHAARRFYGQLLGWTPTGSEDGGNVSTSSLDVGIHGGDPAAELLVFFAVPELAAAAEDVARLGGRVLSDVNSSEGFGQYVVCVDDQGVRFGLHHPS